MFFRTILFLVLIQTSLYAANMNFKGDFRAQTGYFANLGLGAVGPSDVKSFIASRALLRPSLVVDDHFSLHSQWNMLTSNSITADSTIPLGNGQGDYIFGDPGTTGMILSRMWLEWTSDFGVFRIGRMPVSWGYGLLYDAGFGPWDDFQSTLDRIEYRLHLGNVVGGLAYSKQRKNSLLGNTNDQEFFTIFLQYENLEQEVEGGLLFEKQARSPSQRADFLNENAAYNHAAQMGLPAGFKTPYPQHNNVVGAYGRKTINYFTFGGELSWLTGEAYDYNANGANGGKDKLSAIAALVSASYEQHDLKIFTDLLYATGDNDLNSDQLEGYVLLNRNRRGGLILGRELLGNQFAAQPNTMGRGSMVAYSSPGTYSGVLMVRPGLRYNFSQSWATGVEVVIARKAAAATNEPTNLGVEVDLGLDYAVYKNSVLGFNFGYLFAGDALLNSPAPSDPLALRLALVVSM